MAGHSKWANIKHRKAAQDAKRGKIFTKLIREITVAARLGGGDPQDNPRLRAAVDKALSNNMPKDTVERAIKRGVGDEEGVEYETMRYEGYAPGGVAVMADCLTDNRNRTVAEVRHAFNKHGGNLGTDGSVEYLFSQQGVLTYGPDADEDTLMEAALEAGAEDVVTNDDGSKEVLTTPEDFYTVRDTMTEQGLEPEHAEVTQRPATTVALAGEEAEKALKLVDALEDLDDVQNVYTNADFDDEALEQASS
ncbi:YebC/PmpR family DNA-binding transcriptional regulator [Thiohalospira sp.]|uniref:YebC/PmpR family DNA-binding transcriptional regulator n=1 Tax=Thiohalospira sp. TaxID=3080549 RepID=UPI00397F2A32